jgi:secreted trypsin-like serine protease
LKTVNQSGALKWTKGSTFFGTFRSLLYYRTFLCGGSIISEFFILTAAHCYSTSYNPGFTARVGSSYPDRGGLLTAVAKITKHPDYTENPMLHDFDFALVRLEAPIRFGSSIQSIALPSADHELVAGSMAVVSGWGLGENGVTSDVLQKVEVPLIDWDDCFAKYFGTITEQMLCAGIAGKGSCRGC